MFLTFYFGALFTGFFYPMWIGFFSFHWMGIFMSEGLFIFYPCLGFGNKEMLKNLGRLLLKDLVEVG